MRFLIHRLLRAVGIRRTSDTPMSAVMSVAIRSKSVAAANDLMLPAIALADTLTNFYLNAEVVLEKDNLIVHRWGYVTQVNIRIRRVTDGEIEDRDHFPERSMIRQFFEELIDAILSKDDNNVHGGAQYVNKGVYRTCVGTAVNFVIFFSSGRKESFTYFPPKVNQIPIGAG